MLIELNFGNRTLSYEAGTWPQIGENLLLRDEQAGTALRYEVFAVEHNFYLPKPPNPSIPQHQTVSVFLQRSTIT